MWGSRTAVEEETRLGAFEPGGVVFVVDCRTKRARDDQRAASAFEATAITEMAARLVHCSFWPMPGERRHRAGGCNCGRHLVLNRS